MARLLFFGRLSELSGPLEIDVSKDVKTTDDLKLWLMDHYPILKTALTQTGNRIAVNHVMINEPAQLTNADEIAFMSPLSGG